MYGKHPQASGGKGSAIYQGISGLGSAIGLGVSILLTPQIYTWSKDALYSYLARYLRHDFAEILTVVMGGVEGFIIYSVISLLFTFVVTCAIATFAARRFSDDS